MPSKLRICNQALSHLGSGKEIATIDERSAEAAACRMFYDDVVDEVLRDFTWPHATKTADLALVEEDPNEEWDYSYRYPVDCAYARRIPSGSRDDSRQSAISFRVTSDAAGKLILTDEPTPELEYTAKGIPEQYWPTDFAMAVSRLLAVYIAPRVTAGDPYGLGDKQLKIYSYQYTKAQKNAANEGQSDEPPEAEIIRARE